MNYTGERYIPGQVEGDIKIEHIHRYQYITEFIKGKVVLDAACGEGYGTDIMANNASAVYGIDVSEETINAANSKYQKKNLQFVTASIERLPFEDSSIDVIVSFETIEHVNEEIQQKFLVEAKRILKSDGLLIISTPDKQVYSDLADYKNQYHIKEFYVDEFNDFLKEYFQYVYLHSQRFERFSVIKSIGDTSDVYQHNIIRDCDDNVINYFGIYIIAICSATKLDNVSNMQYFLQCNQSFLSRLYLDFGMGFSDEHKITGILRYDGIEFIVNFELPDMRSVKALRWDPLEGEFCRIKLESIMLDKGSILVSSTNASSVVDGFSVFTTIDPIYELSGEYQNAGKMTIKGKMAPISSTNLQEELDKSYAEKSYLQNKLEINLEEKSQLKSVYENSVNELNEKYDIIIDEKNKLESEYSRLHNESKMLKRELESLEAKNAVLQKNYDLLATEGTELKEKCDYYINNWNECNIKLDTLIIKKEELEKNLELILSSHSWKITKPLRNIIDFLRKR